MNSSKLQLFFGFLIISQFVFSQTDSANISRSPYDDKREKMSSILFGVHLQQGIDEQGGSQDRVNLELGYHHSILTNYAAFTYGPSIEVSLHNKPVVGFKYGGWTNIYFFSVGLSTIYYTNFTHGNFALKPEFGAGIRNFRLGVGFNFLPFRNESFTAVKRGSGQVMLNYLLKYRTRN